MKKHQYIITYFTIILILINSTIASTDIFNSEYIITDVDISGKIDIIKEQGSKIDHISANVYFFPKKTNHQDILMQSSDPSAEKTKSINFRWQNPEQEYFIYNIDSKVKTYYNQAQIKKKINFPIDIQDHIEYTQPTNKIDSNNSLIIAKTSEIIEGEDDMYEAVFKIAVWIRDNIHYSLDTLTANAVQKASWTLENKYGVCDEISSLFIAMVRSVGIPARYVSGLAYTNYDGLNDWAPHAWAEVYFPDYGWASFDITYDELGYVDPAHIVLLYSQDTEQSSATYEWKARDVNIESYPLNFNVFLDRKKAKKVDDIDINAEFEKEIIGFGSYNKLTVEIENNKNYYIAERLRISLPEDVRKSNYSVKDILLRPNEVKKISYLVKLNKNLDELYEYEFPVLIYTNKNQSTKTSFRSNHESKVYDKGYFDIQQDEEEKEESKRMIISCKQEEKYYYTYENPKIICSIKNKGNIILKDINLKTEDHSEFFDLNIMQQKNIELSVPAKDYYDITLNNKDISKKHRVNLNIRDTPRISIDEISYPKEVKYDDKFKVEIKLKKESISNPKNVKIYFKRSEKFNISDMEKNHRLVIEMKGKDLMEGDNDINIEILYKDEKGKNYNATDRINISLTNLNPIQKFMLWLNNIFR